MTHFLVFIWTMCFVAYFNFFFLVSENVLHTKTTCVECILCFSDLLSSVVFEVVCTSLQHFTIMFEHPLQDTMVTGKNMKLHYISFYFCSNPVRSLWWCKSTHIIHDFYFCVLAEVDLSDITGVKFKVSIGDDGEDLLSDDAASKIFQRYLYIMYWFFIMCICCMQGNLYNVLFHCNALENNFSPIRIGL